MLEACRRRTSGLTLIELVIAFAISAIVVVFIIQVMVDFARVGVRANEGGRRLASGVQTEARDAVALVQQDLRAASLGSGTGVLWYSSGGIAVTRPAVQIYDNVRGGGLIDVKPGTDALLFVRSVGPPNQAAATVGETFDSTAPIRVTALAPFSVDDIVLLGQYADASWGVVTARNTADTSITLGTTSDANIFPGHQLRRLPAGSLVRHARTRLYYVDTNDELIQVEVGTPGPPQAGTDIVSRTILAAGIENMQIGCEVEGSGGLAACAGAAAAGSALYAEARPALGTFTSGGPRLGVATDPTTTNDISRLRTVAIRIAARTPTPLADQSQGDPKIPLDGVVLPVGGGLPDTAPFLRRSYEVTIGIRNTSLGTL